MRLSMAVCVGMLFALACRTSNTVGNSRDAGVSQPNGGGDGDGDGDGDGNGGGSSSACTSGETQECVGPGACEGAQQCLSDSSGWGECDCGATVGNSGSGGSTGVTGGSSGTSPAGSSNGGSSGAAGGAGPGGSGGAVGTGGSMTGSGAQGGAGGSTAGSGTGGGGAGGAGDPGSSMLSNATVTFAGQASRTFGTYHLSTAYLTPAADYGVFTYQANEGLTQLQFEIEGSAQQGYAVFVMVSDVMGSTAEAQRGSYQESTYLQTQMFVAQLDSCATLSTLEMVPGGQVEASFNCALLQAYVDTPSSMTFTGQFAGQFPQ